MTEWLHFHFSLSCIGEGNGSPLQCSWLVNPRDGGAWWAAVYGVTQSRTRLKQLSSSSSPFQVLLNYKSLQVIESSSLCCTVGPCVYLFYIQCLEHLPSMPSDPSLSDTCLCSPASSDSASSPLLFCSRNITHQTRSELQVSGGPGFRLTSYIAHQWLWTSSHRQSPSLVFICRMDSS